MKATLRKCLKTLTKEFSPFPVRIFLSISVLLAQIWTGIRYKNNQKTVPNIFNYTGLRYFLNCLLFFFVAKVLAQPVDPVVVSGEAQLSSPALQQLFIKASHKAIINWKEFSIGLSELTQFIQPSKDSLVLNRVVGNKASHILGRLEANGHVFLVNPQGIFFGKEAIIDVGGLTASTLAISDENFLKGEFYQFQKVSDQGIVNYGTIRSAGGEVSLLGYQVVNEGKIEAKGGKVALAAGEEILLKPKGNQRIFIKPQPSEKKEEVGIHNLGKIEALKVELRSDGNPYKYAIRHEGVIDALQIQEDGGEVFLTAHKGKNQISGIITTASQEKKGGEIYLLGERIEVTKKAHLSASGKGGGGKILIGGSRHGADPDLPHAKLTFIEEDAHMEANALEQGAGGEIILWSDEATYFYGKMEARGGSKGGNGGFVEISSKKGLFPRGVIDRSAPYGKPGHLYWDPESDITISTHYSYNALSDDGLFTPIADVTNITIGDPMTPNTLLGELQKGPVTISTHFEGEGIAKGGIILSEDICHTYDSPHSLTLSSGGTKGVMIHGSLKNKGEGKIEILSPQGDVKIFPKKSSQEAFLGTKGDLCLGKPSSPIGGRVEISSLAEKSGALKTEEHGHLFIYSKEGIFLESSKKAPATIETEKGNIHLHTRGDLKLTGKEGASAQIATLKGGSIFISGIDKQGLEHIYLLGKGGSAKITADPFSKTLHIHNVRENIILFADQAEAKIEGKGEALAIDRIKGNLQLYAGSGNLAPASIYSKGRAEISVEGAVELQGGIGLFPPPSSIQSEGPLLIKAGKNLMLHAHVAEAFIASEKGIDLHAGENIVLTGTRDASSSIRCRSSSLFAKESILLHSNAHINGKGGALQITSGGDLVLDNPDLAPPPYITAGHFSANIGGQIALSQNASIQTTQGRNTLIATKDITLSDTSHIVAQEGNLHLTSSRGKIHLSGQSRLLAPANSFFLIAGKSLIVDDNAKIKSHGEGGGMILVDEEKTPPYAPIGGGFILGPKASISTGEAPLKIFSGNRSWNAISGTLNRLYFEKAPLYLNTSEEVWGVDYPSSLGGLPFTIFYRDNGKTPILESGSLTHAKHLISVFSGRIITELKENLSKTHDHPHNRTSFRTEYKERERKEGEEKGDDFEAPSSKNYYQTGRAYLNQAYILDR